MEQYVHNFVFCIIFYSPKVEELIFTVFCHFHMKTIKKMYPVGTKDRVGRSGITPTKQFLGPIYVPMWSCGPISDILHFNHETISNEPTLKKEHNYLLLTV